MRSRRTRLVLALSCLLAGGGAVAARLVDAGVGGSRPVVRLTNADSGRTVRVHRGTTLAVALGPDGLIWGEPAPPNGRVLTRVSFSQHHLDGIRAAFRATRSGRTTLASTGGCPPPAPGSAACRLIQLWKVTLIVR